MGSTGCTHGRVIFAFLVIRSSGVDIRLLLLSAGNVSLNRQLNLSRLFPMYAAFPRSEYYKRAPTSTVTFISLRVSHSVDILGPCCGPRWRWISQVP